MATGWPVLRFTMPGKMLVKLVCADRRREMRDEGRHGRGRYAQPSHELRREPDCARGITEAPEASARRVLDFSANADPVRALLPGHRVNEREAIQVAALGRVR